MYVHLLFNICIMYNGVSKKIVINLNIWLNANGNEMEVIVPYTILCVVRDIVFGRLFVTCKINEIYL